MKNYFFSLFALVLISTIALVSFVVVRQSVPPEGEKVVFDEFIKSFLSAELPYEITKDDFN